MSHLQGQAKEEAYICPSATQDTQTQTHTDTCTVKNNLWLLREPGEQTLYHLRLAPAERGMPSSSLPSQRFPWGIFCAQEHQAQCSTERGPHLPLHSLLEGIYESMHEPGEGCLGDDAAAEDWIGLTVRVSLFREDSLKENHMPGMCAPPPPPPPPTQACTRTGDVF